MLTVEQKRAAILKLQRRIVELEAFDPAAVTIRFNNPQVQTLQIPIEETLSDIFGHGTTEYRRYAGAARLDQGPLRARPDWMAARGGGSSEVHEARRYLAEGKERSIGLLQQAIKRLEEEIETEVGEVGSIDQAAPVEPAPALSSDVFIVHGHDEAMREAVARFVSTIGLNPIILHEQANLGDTVIEKVERHSNVGFAVVLLSPDDEGCKKGGVPVPRARQNVILELGYFVGLLGRKKVCALKRGDLELPSDFGGIVYTPFDDSDGWKLKLARELKAAGYEIDATKII